jgi:hypothetical protein
VRSGSMSSSFSGSKKPCKACQYAIASSRARRISYRPGESLVRLGAPCSHYIGGPGALGGGKRGEASNAGERVLHDVREGRRSRKGVFVGCVLLVFWFGCLGCA